MLLWHILELSSCRFTFAVGKTKYLSLVWCYLWMGTLGTPTLGTARQGTPSVHWYMSTFVHGEEEAEIEIEREVSFSHSQAGRGLSWQREDRRSLHILKLLVL